MAASLRRGVESDMRGFQERGRGQSVRPTLGGVRKVASFAGQTVDAGQRAAAQGLGYFPEDGIAEAGGLKRSGAANQEAHPLCLMCPTPGDLLDAERPALPEW